MTESHPKQRSATPMFDFYENGQSRTQNKMQSNSNSLGMLMNGMKQDKSLSDIVNIQQINNNQSLNNFLKEHQSASDFHNQSVREDSFVKTMKKKGSKKATPKNILANN